MQAFLVFLVVFYSFPKTSHSQDARKVDNVDRVHPEIARISGHGNEGHGGDGTVARFINIARMFRNEKRYESIFEQSGVNKRRFEAAIEDEARTIDGRATIIAEELGMGTPLVSYQDGVLTLNRSIFTTLPNYAQTSAAINHFSERARKQQSKLPYSPEYVNAVVSASMSLEMLRVFKKKGAPLDSVEVPYVEVKNVLDRVILLFSNKAVMVHSQPKDANFFSGTGSILVNLTRWQRLDPVDRLTLLFHEVLGLAGFNEEWDQLYKLSEKIFNYFFEKSKEFNFDQRAPLMRCQSNDGDPTIIEMLTPYVFRLGDSKDKSLYIALWDDGSSTWNLFSKNAFILLLRNETNVQPKYQFGSLNDESISLKVEQKEVELHCKEFTPSSELIAYANSFMTEIQLMLSAL